MEAFKDLADVILNYTEAEMVKRVEDGGLLAVEKPEEGESGG